MDNNLLDKIDNVYIDDDGIFKYIQIYLKSGNQEKVIVRGYADLDLHMNIFKRFQDKENKQNKIEAKAIGGGRIDINKENKTIFVYGYSKSYGICDHNSTCDLLIEKYNDYEITWSNDGY